MYLYIKIALILLLLTLISNYRSTTTTHPNTTTEVNLVGTDAQSNSSTDEADKSKPNLTLSLFTTVMWVKLRLLYYANN